eukprot:GABU01009351.1.p1 GENE.GABU01009351.1~~GABU01009351.1.p1  ORF type:complete len:227 (+),score=56.89 GABU01009351.1:404-1084(+)
MDDPMEESVLLAATDEINKFEDFLKDGIHKMYTFDTESRGLILRYSKTLLETSHRILASICTDHQKSSETYKQLLGKYNQGFEDYLKAFASLKPDAKIDENLREDVVNYLNNLGTIKIDQERAAVFVEVAGLGASAIERFGATYCFVGLVLPNLLDLIRVDDAAIRTAVSALLKEFLIPTEHKSTRRNSVALGGLPSAPGSQQRNKTRGSIPVHHRNSDEEVPQAA